MRANTVVDMVQVHKTFDGGSGPTAVLRDFSISLRGGETVALVGPSGCGKSTVIGLIAGLESPTSGSVRVQTTRLGTVLQGTHLLPWRTARRNARLGLELMGERFRESHLDAGLVQFGLLKHEDHYPHELSGGLRQKVALLRAMLIEPELLLLDEAMTSIDYDQRIIIETHCIGWLRKRGATCVVVTHDIDHAVAMADRVLVLGRYPVGLVAEVRTGIDRSRVGNGESSAIDLRADERFGGAMRDVWEALRP